ncbi:unnamed protein product [Cyprideis torosa]|uniref:Uncharacterized protein n=1 Tax=Cyprideis torosa TaxID=163714 RepID=A0A7R8WWB7_9CRUS|nr:unnamed protein product [Cyprideis torosa]CAG0910576.1 unnamed protein product [Cyprideis torosa]
MTKPEFEAEAQNLVGTARGLSIAQIKSMMKLSDNLAKLNYDRFRDFSVPPQPENLRPAVRAFAGDTYLGLEAGSLDAEEMAWAQDHLRILSGLYGVLRPLDGMQPYRLEMGSRLQTERGRNLYEFWSNKIAKALNKQAQALGTDVLVNCASQEYFGAVDQGALALQVITPQFMEDKGGEPKIVSFYAKRARGAMARFIIQHRLSDPAALLDFDTGGYRYRAELSTPEKPIFVRPAEAATKSA